nr:MAG TPA: hypothetical protein [Caudoviricetes sp.]
MIALQRWGSTTESLDGISSMTCVINSRHKKTLPRIT